MMTIGFTGLLGAIITLVFGILVLAFPKFLRIFVGLWFIIAGLLGLIGSL